VHFGSDLLPGVFLGDLGLQVLTWSFKERHKSFSAGPWVQNLSCFADSISSLGGIPSVSLILSTCLCLGLGLADEVADEVSVPVAEGLGPRDLVRDGEEVVRLVQVAVDDEDGPGYELVVLIELADGFALSLFCALATLVVRAKAA
jgi:hypothetical protein